MTTAPAKKAAPRKTPARKADPYEPILADLKARLGFGHVQPGLPLRGGVNPEKGREHFQQRNEHWRSFNEGREDSGRLGHDGVLLEDLYFALSMRTDDDAMHALLNVAARIVEIAKHRADR
ncbi:hypothetical protein AB0A60_25505 [Streptomyces sp. NPDC046275]|uniref:hypothetical protein n=1 Tax=Streptomyces sp. NPDC046275 TaxID=3157201 RepID=UPI0033D7D33D